MNGRILESCVCFGVGIGLGMIFAPKSGREARSLISREAHEGAEYVRKRGEKIRANTEMLVQKGRDAMVHQMDGVKAALQAGKGAYSEALKSKQLKQGLGMTA